MFLTNQVNACMEWTSQNTHIPDVCSLFHGSKIIRRIDENSYADELCISVNDHNERNYEFTVPVATIVDHPTLLATFVGKGLALSYYMVQSLSEYLMNDYRECKKARRIEYRHKRLGWHNYQGQDYFLYDQTQIGNTLSKCTRTNFRFTGGDEATYRQFLADTVYPVPTLALAMAIGYSAPVVTRLKDYADTGTITVSVVSGRKNEFLKSISTRYATKKRYRLSYLKSYSTKYRVSSTKGKIYVVQNSTLRPLPLRDLSSVKIAVALCRV